MGKLVASSQGGAAMDLDLQRALRFYAGSTWRALGLLFPGRA